MWNLPSSTSLHKIRTKTELNCVGLDVIMPDKGEEELNSKLRDSSFSRTSCFRGIWWRVPCAIRHLGTLGPFSYLVPITYLDLSPRWRDRVVVHVLNEEIRVYRHRTEVQWRIRKVAWNTLNGLLLVFVKVADIFSIYSKAVLQVIPYK